MPASYVNSTAAGSSASVNSLSVAWPSTTSGDTVYLYAVINSTTPTFTTPSGFTSVFTVNAGSTLKTQCWAHRCDGSESGNITVAWTGGAAFAVVAAAAYRNCDPSNSGLDVLQFSSVASASSGTIYGYGTVGGGTYQRNPQAVLFQCDYQTSGQVNITIDSTLTLRGSQVSSSGPYITVAVADNLTPRGTGAYTAPNLVAAATVLAAAGVSLPLAPWANTLQAVYPGACQSSELALFGYPIPPTGQLWPRGVTNI